MISVALSSIFTVIKSSNSAREKVFGRSIVLVSIEYQYRRGNMNVCVSIMANEEKEEANRCEESLGKSQYD